MVLDKIQLLLLYTLAFFSVFPTGIQSITIILFVSISFVNSIVYKRYSFNKKEILIFLFGSVWVFFLGLTLFYSLETTSGIKQLQRLINIILIPFTIFFLFPSLSEKQIKTIMKLFILSNFILAIYSLIFIFNNISVSDKAIRTYSELFWYGLKQAKNEPTLLIHKAYFSVQLLLSQYFLVIILRKTYQKSLIKSIIYFLLVLNGLLIFFFFSKINLFLLILFSGIFFVYIQKGKRKKVISSVLFGIIITISFLTALNLLKGDRFLKKNILGKANFVIGFFTEYNADNNVMDNRTLIYRCALDLIKERPILGYGIGSQQMYLDNCYAKNENFVMYNGNYNSHNYFFFLLLSGGIFICIPFVLMLVYFVKIGVEGNNKMFVYFILIIAVNLMFENLFSRINGVLLFAIFYPIIFKFQEKLL